MSIIISQDGFTVDSKGWRPTAPLDEYDVLVRVVQRYDEKKGGQGVKPRTNREINLSIEHTCADSETFKDSVVLPLNTETAAKLIVVLQQAIKDAENPKGAV